MSRNFKNYSNPDLVTVFFKDVANQPIIAGKSDYRPLVRRIERGRLIKKANKADSTVTLLSIKNRLAGRLEKLKIYFSNQDIAVFFSNAAEEIEQFLDDPCIDCPSSISGVLDSLGSTSSSNEVRLLLWDCFYLLSLFPQNERDNWQTSNVSSDLENHFDIVTTEYEESKDALLIGTLRYAIRLARHYIHTDIPYLDLVQEGILGIIQSFNRYKEAEGAHFQHYASSWIKQKITRYVADHSRLIRIPVHQHDQAKEINKRIEILRDQSDQYPTDYEIFVAMEWLTQEEIDLVKQFESQKYYRKVREEVDFLEGYFKYIDTPIDEIPNKFVNRVSKIKEAYNEIHQELGGEPDTLTVFRRLGWISDNDLAVLAEKRPELDRNLLSTVQTKLHKARLQLNRYRMTNAIHYSLEDTLIDSKYGELFIDEFLVEPRSTQDIGDQQLLSEEINAVLGKLSFRERKIIELRFGLLTGEEQTLQEIGEKLGVTRERIRQIESNALRKIRHPTRRSQLHEFFTYLEHRISSSAEQFHQELLRLLSREEYTIAEDIEMYAQEKTRIDELINEYVMQGRSRTTSTRTHGSRPKMFKTILEDSGKPLHYSMIHECALQMLPNEHHYPKERTYAALFYSDLFQLLGDGVFGLAAWDMSTLNGSGERILQHCPQPLLPEKDDVRAFFESIMVGRDILKRHNDITARRFYMEMQAWAGRDDSNWVNARSAFEAWYAVGLIDWVEDTTNEDHSIHLALASDAKVGEVRQYCLENICRRIRKMPELLLTLKRVARARISDIQKVLFGSERLGFDVQYRLKILLAFEAVQRIGDEWRLTALGEALLQSHPPQDLPDFSVIDEAVADEDNEQDDLDWEAELGLLDL